MTNLNEGDKTTVMLPDRSIYKNGRGPEPPAVTTPAVEVADLTRSLPMAGKQLRILNGLSFSITPGEWVALTGASGSGKSTLLGIIAGLDTPTSGGVKIDGVDISSMGE